MAYLIDSNVAINLRDGDREVRAKLGRLGAPHISVMTVIELEAGNFADPIRSEARRVRWAEILPTLTVYDVDATVASIYARIVAARGFSRPRIIDRLIAANAIVHGLTLVTINGDDFRDIPGLHLEVWPAPAQ